MKPSLEYRFEEVPKGWEFVTATGDVFVKVDPDCEFARLLGAEGKRLAVHVGAGTLVTFGKDTQVGRPDVARTGLRTPI